MTTVERPKGRCARIEWDEVDHFAGYGWSTERIASRLGVQHGSLRTGLHRRARSGDPAAAEVALRLLAAPRQMSGAAA